VIAGGPPPRRGALAAALLFPLFAVACANQDAVLGVSVRPQPGMQVSFSKDIVGTILAGPTPKCAVSGCHAAPLFAPMSLEPDQAYGSLVGIAACEAPQLLRVKPGDSTASYLVVKVEGRQSTVNSCMICASDPTSATACGAQMPPSPTPLSDVEIALIRTWIDQGAPNN